MSVKRNFTWHWNKALIPTPQSLLTLSSYFGLYSAMALAKD